MKSVVRGIHFRLEFHNSFTGTNVLIFGCLSGFSPQGKQTIAQLTKGKVRETRWRERGSMWNIVEDSVYIIGFSVFGYRQMKSLKQNRSRKENER